MRTDPHSAMIEEGSFCLDPWARAAISPAFIIFAKKVTPP